MQTIISFYQSTKDTLRGFTAGDVRFVVMSKGPLNLVAITRLPESDSQLRTQLEALYMQILSTLTLPSMERMFAARANYDLRRPLQGTETLLSALADGFTRGSPSTLLSALECLKLRKSHRSTINNTLLKTRSDNLLYGLIVASGKLVSVVRPKKHSLHPGDLHLIFNMLFEAGSVKAGGGENWIPLCLPGFNNTGYLYMYVSFLNLQNPGEQMEERPRTRDGGEDEVAVLLISADKESFFEMRKMRDNLVEVCVARFIVCSPRRHLDSWPHVWCVSMPGFDFQRTTKHVIFEGLLDRQHSSLSSRIFNSQIAYAPCQRPARHSHDQPCHQRSSARIDGHFLVRHRRDVLQLLGSTCSLFGRFGTANSSRFVTKVTLLNSLKAQPWTTWMRDEDRSCSNLVHLSILENTAGVQHGFDSGKPPHVQCDMSVSDLPVSGAPSPDCQQAIRRTKQHPRGLQGTHLDHSCRSGDLLRRLEILCLYPQDTSKHKLTSHPQALSANNSIAHISAAVQAGRPSCTDIVPGSPLRHFLYKSRGNVQFCMPAYTPYFASPLDRRRLLSLYAHLHSTLHARPTSLKIHHETGSSCIALAWSTPLFELYAVAPPNTSRAALAQGAMKVVQWVRREEERVFIIGGAVF